jgi:hypothetical protein
MKTIDEIEKLSLEDLERISMDESIPVPEDLGSKLTKRTSLWFISIAASLLIVAGIGLTWFNRSKPLEDTFDDPAVAYAMLENTLMRFSDSVEISVKSVEKSRDILHKPTEVLSVINIDENNK